MEMNIRMWINRKPWLSPTVYNSLQRFAEFKVDMHNIYIRVHKDPTKQWIKLPFVDTEDAIFYVLEAWQLEWHTPDIAKTKKFVVQKKKDDAKLCITQLAEKQRKEATRVE